MDNIEYQKKTRGYKRLKPVMKFLFNSYFKPKVIGIENIPKQGAFILCMFYFQYLRLYLLMNVCLLLSQIIF